MSALGDVSEPSLWVVVGVTALWALVLGRARGEAAATIRSLAFAGGPLLLLAGLHARLAGYLHARARLDLLPLPLPPREHWRLAARGHRRGLALTLACGLGGLVVGLGGDAAIGPAIDFAWLCVVALVVEPMIPGAAAWFGRRFAEGSAAAQAQRTLAAGWSAPEAAVHLYAPALGVGLAAALAMPGQLALEHFGPTPPALPWLAAPLSLAIVLRLVAPRLYAGGLWEAVPRLHESIRSLAGPAEVDPPPAIVGRLPAALRLDVLQWLRLRPLPLARLVALVGWTALVISRGSPPGAAHLAVGLALAGLWLAPWAAVARDRRRRALLLAALPVAAGARRGALCGASLAIAAAPPLVFVAACLARALAER